MWVIAEYQSSSLFSLKSSLATSSAGKTLLVPTPFALKMALLDAAIRTRGLAQGKIDFEWIRGLEVAISPATTAVVTNLFAKIQKPRRTDKSKEEKSKEEAETEPHEDKEIATGGPFGPTIAYREYVHFQGLLGLAFEVGTVPVVDAPEVLAGLMLHFSYLGKRGSLFQITNLPEMTEILPAKYVPVSGEATSVFFGGILQVLDDCGPDLTFDKANIYSEKKIKLGKDRVLRSVILPYELKRSSRSYSLYQRIGQE